jgi:hypothetical protein
LVSIKKLRRKNEKFQKKHQNPSTTTITAITTSHDKLCGWISHGGICLESTGS